MIKITHPTKIAKGSIGLPASKSLSNRALIIQALCEKPFAIDNLSTAEDTVILQKALHDKKGKIDVGDAGTAMRFLIAYFATQDKETTLIGSKRMNQRPVGPLVDALRDMGADITYLENDGFAPVKIKGSTNLRKSVSIKSDVSSQFISALMLIGPAIGGLSIKLLGEPTSFSYIEMTASLMEHFEAEVEFKGSFVVVKNSEYRSNDYTVEPDWSAASYFLEIAALAQQANIYMEKLPWYSIQGDSAVASLYQGLLGVSSGAKFNGVHVQKGEFEPDLDEEYDFADLPDMAQTVAATAAGMQMTFSLTGLQTLRIKETDRIAALKTELEKTGVSITTGDDWLTVKPTGKTPKTTTIKFSSHNDHRMAMALAPLALVFDEVIIDDETVVKKSFPNYWEELKKLGFEIA